MRKSVKPIYANKKQLQIIHSLKKIKCFVGGRGSGKSTVCGYESYQALTTMPRSRGFIAGADDTKIKLSSLPSIIEAWEMLGMEEGVDFVVGRRPPSFFLEPYNKPKRYDKVISFANGSAIDMLSFYNKNPGRGGNYQWGIIDEAALVSKVILDRSLLPAMRGNYHKLARLEIDARIEIPYGRIEEKRGKAEWVIPFNQNPRYMMIIYSTTIPWSSAGNWIFELEHDDLCEYVEATAWDNLAVLGPNYIPRLEKSLPPAIFKVEVMNERIKQLEDGFYPYFQEEKHVITQNKYDPNKQLEISLDFNAGFNSMIVCQERGDIAYMHDALYVVGNKLVSDLIDDFTEKYKNHKFKKVIIYGDRNGNNRHADSKLTIYQKIENNLREKGWTLYRPQKGLDAFHKDKHEMLNLALRETSQALPKIRVYKANCSPVCISIMQAPMKEGFKKDKRSESRLKGTERRVEATDLSDCFDNWYYAKWEDAWRIENPLGSPAGGLTLGGL